MKNRTNIIIAVVIAVAVIGGGIAFASSNNRSNGNNSSQASSQSSNQNNQSTSQAPASTSNQVDLLAVLKTVTPIDACQKLPASLANSVFPGQDFKIYEELKPRESGYEYISRCEYRSGDLGGGIPSHTLSITVRTNATENEAQSFQMRQFEGSTTVTGYKPQPAIEQYAYSATNIGLAKLYFQKGLAVYELNASNLDDSPEVRTTKLLKIAEELVKK